jgi:hypothetical protein
MVKMDEGAEVGAAKIVGKKHLEHKLPRHVLVHCVSIYNRAVTIHNHAYICISLGVIIPPPDIRSVVDKTAQFVAPREERLNKERNRSGTGWSDRMKQRKVPEECRNQ